MTKKKLFEGRDKEYRLLFSEERRLVTEPFSRENFVCFPEKSLCEFSEEKDMLQGKGIKRMVCRFSQCSLFLGNRGRETLYRPLSP